MIASHNNQVEKRAKVHTQGSIYFIHDIQGSGLVVVQGKDQGQGAQGLLPA